MNILRVRNIEQAAAWLELDGQLSDGFWENARPSGHWKVWCDAKVEVDPLNVGRNFPARKVNYDLAAPDLLKVVENRMLGIVRIARHVRPTSGLLLGPAERLAIASALEFAVDCETGRIDWAASWNERLVRTLWDSFGINPENVNLALADESYTLAHLRADLRDLKAIMKERSTDQPPDGFASPEAREKWLAGENGQSDTGVSGFQKDGR